LLEVIPSGATTDIKVKAYYRYSALVWVAYIECSIACFPRNGALFSVYRLAGARLQASAEHKAAKFQRWVAEAAKGIQP